VSELSAVATDLSPDLILVTETWCKSEITNAYLAIPGYELQADLRRDREDTVNGIGGGLLVYAKHGLAVLPGDDLGAFAQHTSFKISTGNDSLNLVLIYRPPNTGPTSLDNFKELLCNVKNNTVLIGDFNLPEIDWNLMNAPNRFMNIVNECSERGLSQLVNFPTHLKGNILDLVLTNIADRVTSIEDQGRLGTSDHIIMSVKISTSNKAAPSTEKIPDWSRADWAALKRTLGDPALLARLERTETEAVWETLRDEVNRAVADHVPKKLRRAGNKPKWMCRDILRALRRKRRVWKKEKNKDSQEYREIEKKVKNLIRNAKRNYERKLARQSKENSRPFYAYLKRKTKSRTSVGPIRDSNGDTITDPGKMAELINNYFSSVFTREADGPPPTTDEEVHLQSELTNFHITVNKVKEKIRKLRPAAAPGPDSIGAGLLQELQDQLAPALCIVFKKLLEDRHAPEDWKMAHVTPIYKKGPKHDPGNYRPVSLTSVSCKIFESLVKDSIIAHLDRNGLINENQHGFVSSRSCATNLIEFYDQVTLALDNNTPVDVAYLDFSKAFDKVPHKALMSKLRAYGVRGKVADWIEAWLSQRRMRVVINGKGSSWREILSGVPQGSVLGPILFVIYINDIGCSISNTFYNMFADDTKIGKVLRTENDGQELQEALKGAESWSLKWGMPFNVDKCKVMHLGTTNPRNTYRMAGQNLAATDLEKDVGVQVTPSMKWDQHCAKAARTANMVLGQISRAFSYRDKTTFLRLYKSYVRPHLEFSSPAWRPWLRRDINLLEKVQQRAVNMVGGLHGTYSEKLEQLGLQSLEARRKEADLLLMQKVTHGKCKVNSDRWIQERIGGHNTRAAADATRLSQPRARLEIRRQFYTVRIASEWNELPADLREIGLANRFKTALRAHERTRGRHQANEAD